MVVYGGTLSISADANLGNSNGTVTLDGNDSTLQLAGVNSSRSITLTAPAGTIHVLNGFTATLSGTTSGSGSLAKVGPGTLALTGANTYSGGTIVKAGAIQIVSDSNNVYNLGNPSGALTLDGGRLQTSLAVNSARNVVLASGGGTIDTLGNNSTLSGAISGVGTLNKAGSGRLALSGANTFAGDTTISSGQLRLDNSLALQNSTLDHSGAGTLIFGSTLNSATLGGLKGDQNLVLSNITNQPVNLSVGNNNASTSYSGNLSGNGILTKVGSGTLTLSGNANSAAVNVVGGTLVVKAPLTGDLINSATVTKGTVPGQLDVSGTYTQTSLGTLRTVLANNAGSNAFTVGTSAALAGTLSLDTSQLASIAPGQSFTVLTAPSIDRLFDNLNITGPSAGSTFVVKLQTVAGGPLPGQGGGPQNSQADEVNVVRSTGGFGDVDGDNHYKAADIACFAAALYDPNAFNLVVNTTDTSGNPEQVWFNPKDIFDLWNSNTGLPGTDGKIDFDDLQRLSELIAADNSTSPAQAFEQISVAYQAEVMRHVPEPETWILMGLGMLAFLQIRKKRS
jgi:autotransporter-associated beta strand protein